MSDGRRGPLGCGATSRGSTNITSRAHGPRQRQRPVRGEVADGPAVGGPGHAALTAVSFSQPMFAFEGDPFPVMKNVERTILDKEPITRRACVHDHS
jgi:hypothetical protein